MFSLHSCPTCCWTPREPTPRLACTPCSLEKASRSTPNQRRKSSKGACKDVALFLHPLSSLYWSTSREFLNSHFVVFRCNSEVKYDSDKHYRDRVFCTPVPTATSFSETVVAVRNCTWRSYKTQVYLEPRQRPVSYQSTTIIYPKHAKNTYRTTLNYNATGSRRWYVSTVKLESSEDTSPCIIYTEDL